MAASYSPKNERSGKPLMRIRFCSSDHNRSLQRAPVTGRDWGPTSSDPGYIVAG